MCRSDILRLHQLGDVSTFESTLEAGLSALKTHQCFHENCRSEACPVCSTQLNSIAKRLPFAACTQVFNIKFKGHLWKWNFLVETGMFSLRRRNERK